MDPKKDWHVIAEHASKEMDPEKLLILADKLCEAFDEEQTRVANLQTVNWMISSSGTSAIQPAEEGRQIRETITERAAGRGFF
jgi:hypothetical protein